MIGITQSTGTQSGDRSYPAGCAMPALLRKFLPGWRRGALKNRRSFLPKVLSIRWGLQWHSWSGPREVGLEKGRNSLCRYTGRCSNCWWRSRGTRWVRCRCGSGRNCHLLSDVPPRCEVKPQDAGFLYGLGGALSQSKAYGLYGLCSGFRSVPLPRPACSGWSRRDYWCGSSPVLLLLWRRRWVCSRTCFGLLLVLLLTA